MVLKQKEHKGHFGFYSHTQPAAGRAMDKKEALDTRMELEQSLDDKDPIDLRYARSIKAEPVFLQQGGD